MSFTIIFEDRDYFEQFKKLLPNRWSLDIEESRQYKFFKAIGNEFIQLMAFGKQVALSRWVGVPEKSPNVAPEDIDTDTESINLLQIGGNSIRNVGELLNQPLYETINEKEKTYRNRLIGTVGGIFGGGSKPSIIQALEFATIRFNGLGANPDGYTPDIIETTQPISKYGTLSNPPTTFTPTGTIDAYYNFGTESNIPSENEPIYDAFSLPNDYTKWGSEGQYKSDRLHFIVEFEMDNIESSPTDYEYWGGEWINGAYTPPLTDEQKSYMNNYLFLRELVQSLKLAGVTFEIQIGEL